MDNDNDVDMDYDDVNDAPFMIEAPTLACDFDGDGLCRLSDLNALLAEGTLALGMPILIGGNDQFYLDGNGTLDLDDVDRWLSDAASENGLGSPYRRGDADLNGVVDGADFLAWNAQKFNLSLRWDHGDFDGDGVVNGSDFLLWNQGKFQPAVASAVPEPARYGLWIASLVLARCPRRRARCQSL